MALDLLNTDGSVNFTALTAALTDGYTNRLLPLEDAISRVKALAEASLDSDLITAAEAAEHQVHRAHWYAAQVVTGLGISLLEPGEEAEEDEHAIPLTGGGGGGKTNPDPGDGGN